MADNRKFYETKTFIGIALYTVGAVLIYYGVAVDIAGLLQVVGLPVGVYGIADRFRK